MKLWRHVILTDFFANNENWEIQFLRGEPYFFKIIKYSFLGARTNYGATVFVYDIGAFVFSLSTKLVPKWSSLVY